MNIRLEHRPAPVQSPLTPWVHTGLDGPHWKATRFEPPLPTPVDGKGYPIWIASHRGREIHFASPQELEHAADILGRRILPTSRDLGRPFLAVNSHWLSRLHSTWKPWKVRQRLVKRIAEALAENKRGGL